MRLQAPPALLTSLQGSTARGWRCSSHGTQLPTAPGNLPVTHLAPGTHPGTRLIRSYPRALAVPAPTAVPSAGCKLPCQGESQISHIPKRGRNFSCFILCIFLPPPPRPTFRSFWLFFPLCPLPVLPLATPSASRPPGQPRSWLLLQPGQPLAEQPEPSSSHACSLHHP